MQSEIVLENGFKCGDKVKCVIFGEERVLEVFSSNKKEGELLDEEERAEVGWLLSSNVLEDKTVVKKALKYINDMYEEWDDNHVKSKDLAKEVTVTNVKVDISEDDAGDTGEVLKIVAFCGETPCDEEHGISISFKSRKFMSVQDEVAFNEDPEPAFNYRKWKEENPLMGMVPKSANVLIKNGLTDERKICFFTAVFYGKFNLKVKMNLKKWVLPSKQRKCFVGYAVGVKGDELLMIKHSPDTDLKNEIKSYFVISKKDIVRAFALTKDYPVKLNPKSNVVNYVNHYCNAHFVLKDGNILIFARSTGDPIINFLLTEFGNITPPTV